MVFEAWQRERNTRKAQIGGFRVRQAWVRAKYEMGPAALGGGKGLLVFEVWHRDVVTTGIVKDWGGTPSKTVPNLFTSREHTHTHRFPVVIQTGPVKS